MLRMERNNFSPQDLRQAFLKQAVEEGAYKIVPPNITPEKWVLMRNIGAVYYGSEATLDDIGALYGYSMEWIRRVRNGFLEKLWGNCTIETRKQYPFSRMPKAKTLSIKLRRERSLKMGGSSAVLAEKYNSGMTDIGKILEATGLSRRQINSSRSVLENWGIHIPKTPNRYRDVSKRINEEEDNGRLQAYLDELSGSSILGYAWRAKSSRQEDLQPVFVKLRHVLREGGYRTQSLRIFADVLSKEGMPLRKIPRTPYLFEGRMRQPTTYVVLNKRKSEVLRVLNSRPELEHFRKT
jgi:biotin operon repressor